MTTGITSTHFPYLFRSMEGVAGDPSVPSNIVGDERGAARPVIPERNECPMTTFLPFASQTGRFGDFECDEAPPEWLAGQGCLLAGVALSSALSKLRPQRGAMHQAHCHMRRVMAHGCRRALDNFGFRRVPGDGNSRFARTVLRVRPTPACSAGTPRMCCCRMARQP